MSESLPPSSPKLTTSTAPSLLVSNLWAGDFGGGGERGGGGEGREARGMEPAFIERGPGNNYELRSSA